MTQTLAIADARGLFPGTLVRYKTRPQSPQVLRRLVRRRLEDDGWTVQDARGEPAPWLRDVTLVEKWEVVAESGEPPADPDLVPVPRETVATLASWWRSGNLGSINQDTRRAFNTLVELVRDPRREKVEGLAFVLFQEHRRSFKLPGGPAAWRSLLAVERQAFLSMAEVALEMLEEDDA